MATRTAENDSRYPAAAAAHRLTARFTLPATGLLHGEGPIRTALAAGVLGFDRQPGPFPRFEPAEQWVHVPQPVFDERSRRTGARMLPRSGAVRDDESIAGDVVEVILDLERTRLRTELVENGQDGALRTLRQLRRVGFIGTPTSLGWDLHYASEVPMGTSRRIVLATDRPISFWEQVNQPRTIDYPFTVIEMRIGPDGKGEGKMTIATRVRWNPDDRTVELENWDAGPAQLLNVREEK